MSTRNIHVNTASYTILVAGSYSYALSRGVDTQFRHINIAEADHFKQFLRQIKRAGLDIRAIC